MGITLILVAGIFICLVVVFAMAIGRLTDLGVAEDYDVQAEGKGYKEFLQTITALSLVAVVCFVLFLQTMQY